MKKRIAILMSCVMLMGVTAGCTSEKEISAEDLTQKTSETASGENGGHGWEPEKNITVIVPWAPGGGADILMRAFVNTASKYTDTPMIIQNEEGAGGVTGTTTAANAQNDGYTIVVAQTGPMVTQRVMTELSYDPIEDFEYIGALNFEGVLVCVSKDSPYQTLDDLVAAAQETELLWSCSAVGSVGYFFGEYFALENNMKNRVLPCAGGAEAVTNLIGGQVDYAVVQPAESDAYYRSGDLRVLGLGEAETNELYPDMPTMLEQGYEGYEEMGVLRALALPAGVDSAVLDWYVDLCQKVCSDEEFQEICRNASVIIEWRDGETVSEMFETDYEIYRTLAEQLGIQ